MAQKGNLGSPLCELVYAIERLKSRKSYSKLTQAASVVLRR